jgi:hypothetical protein
MKLYVYKMKDEIEKSWDDVDFDSDIEVVATIEGESNEECESKASEEYGDTDIYGWTYTDIENNFTTKYDKDGFLEMVKDWKADNAPEMDDLEIKEIEIDEETGNWVAYAQDEKTAYTLNDDGHGNITINYSGSR